jgi:hypothetical protein
MKIPCQFIRLILEYQPRLFSNKTVRSIGK